ncbi:MAG: CopG family antitoxin [Bryobacteraceae bacterium]
MKRQSQIGGKAQKASLGVPKFNSEAEEASWWDKNLDNFHGDIIAKGHYRPTLNVRRTKSVTIRLAQDDIELAKSLASAHGLPYQTLVKDLLHQALANCRSRPVRSRS